MKLDFEIAVVQQTKACDRTFEGVPDSGCPPVPAGQPCPYFINLWSNFAISPKHAQNHALNREKKPYCRKRIFDLGLQKNLLPTNRFFFLF